MPLEMFPNIQQKKHWKMMNPQPRSSLWPPVLLPTCTVFLKIIGAPFNSWKKKRIVIVLLPRRHAEMPIWGSQITSDLYGSSHERYPRYPSSSVLNHRIVSIWQPTNLNHQMQHLATTICYRNIRIWIYTFFLKTKMAGTLPKSSEKRTKNVDIIYFARLCSWCF